MYENGLPAEFDEFSYTDLDGETQFGCGANVYIDIPPFRFLSVSVDGKLGSAEFLKNVELSEEIIPYGNTLEEKKDPRNEILRENVRFLLKKLKAGGYLPNRNKCSPTLHMQLHFEADRDRDMYLSIDEHRGIFKKEYIHHTVRVTYGCDDDGVRSPLFRYAELNYTILYLDRGQGWGNTEEIVL